MVDRDVWANDGTDTSTHADVHGLQSTRLTRSQHWGEQCDGCGNNRKPTSAHSALAARPLKRLERRSDLIDEQLNDWIGRVVAYWAFANQYAAIARKERSAPVPACPIACRLLARSIISLRRSDLAAFGVKRTSNSAGSNKDMPASADGNAPNTTGRAGVSPGAASCFSYSTS